MISDKKWFAISLGLMMLSLSLLVGFQLWNGRSEEAEIRLSALTGRIHEYDTMMTVAVQQMLDGHRPEAEQTYLSNLALYTQSMLEILASGPPEQLRHLLYSTYGSQKTAASIEQQAMKLCRHGQCDTGLKLLDAKLYQQRKLEASEGLERVLLQFQSDQLSQNDQTQNFLFGFELLMVLCNMAMLAVWRRGQTVRTQLLVNQTRLQTLQVTMRTVMDVVNNNLNRLRLLQVRWKKKQSLEPEELQHLSDLIQETSAKLKLIGDMDAYKTYGEGPAELLQWHQEPAKV